MNGHTMEIKLTVTVRDGDSTTASIALSDEDAEDAYRLGNLIGDALNAVSPFVVPGDLLSGLYDSLKLDGTAYDTSQHHR